MGDHLIGLLLGAEKDWPRAFETVLRMVGPIKDGGAVHTLSPERLTIEPFKLDGVMQKMHCPFLLVHGAEDEQIPLADAQKQFDACGSKDKTFRVFTAEEGGAQHCQRDYLSLVVAEMWNWFDEKLLRS